ncbi:MAG: glycerol kinase GlpK [Lachnospiraceae bacterium]|nr:glycerol kinase GlpK [Lachnospiraceae bacterium]
MEEKYLLAIDQSTQGTKALLLDQAGQIVCRRDLPHRQIVDEHGWISHDLNEIYRNTVQAVKAVIEGAGVARASVIGLGLSNQRETSAVWDRLTGEPVADAIVWQCGRAEEICARVRAQGAEEMIRRRTGIPLSPYFPAAKFAWLLEHTEGTEELQKEGRLLFGTIDTWLLYKLTGGAVYRTDYSNASRTQLFNLETRRWDPEICALFGLRPKELPEVCDSNALLGMTDFNGYLSIPIPIHAALGDSHAALFGQGCLTPGMAKATYGTGSSVMMQVGEHPVYSENGAVTSLAWGIDGKISYVLEGNINYTGAVISWLQKDLGLIASPQEAEELARQAAPADRTYLVPAFTGLGMPYWDSDARALLCGLSRTTGRAEIARAALESIAYQVTDVLEVLRSDAGLSLETLRVDGGPTRNATLMQFQSDMAGLRLEVPRAEELSGLGAGYLAGISLGFYDRDIFERMERQSYEPSMEQSIRNEKYAGWKRAVALARGR